MLPVGGVSKTLFIAWPSDHLEEFLEPYDLFAIGQCQCRIAMQLTGKGCDRPTNNCVGIGPISQLVIDRGLMRKASRQEVLEAKRAAEQKGCVTWMANELGDRRGNVSCSCCGCCCHALRSITELNAPGMVSAPHYLPTMDSEACTTCARCVAACPMGAWTTSRPGAKPDFNRRRCIGCGLCVVQCKPRALELKPVASVRPPENSWLSLLSKMAPGYLANAGRVWARHAAGALWMARKSGSDEPQKLTVPADSADTNPQNIAADDEFVYWTSWGACVNASGCANGSGGTDALRGRVQRVRKDGTDLQVLYDGFSLPTGIAVDDEAVYWTTWWFTVLMNLAK